MLKNNNIKTKLLNGSPVIGTWNTLSSPLLTESLAISGLDFQIIDLEHGPFILDKRKVSELLGKLVNINPILI